MDNIKLFQQIKQVFNTESLEKADATLRDVLANLGMGKFTYNYYPKQFLQEETRHTVCTGQVQAWEEYYVSRHYHQIDPIFNRMRKSVTPLSWILQEELLDCDEQQKQLYCDAIDFGFHGGFAIPIHTPYGEFANLVIQDVAAIKLIQEYPEIESALQLIACHYQAAVSYHLEQANTIIHLTDREIQCLQLTANHLSAKQIAATLQITPRTVGFHLENALKKLMVNNKHHAVTKAMQLGLL